MGRSIGLSRISTADNSSSLFSVKIFISSPVPAPKSRILPVTVYASIIRSTSCLISPRLVPPEHLAACRRKSRKSDFMSTSASLPHARGQDALTALLASQEYANVPLKILKRGKDIIQYFGSHGYTISERLSNVVFGAPTFIHSQGPKPWIQDWQRR